MLITTIAEGRRRRAHASITDERLRVVEPFKNTLVRIVVEMDSGYELKWELNRTDALALASALREAALRREPTEIIQSYLHRR